MQLDQGRDRSLAGRRGDHRDRGLAAGDRARGHARQRAYPPGRPRDELQLPARAAAGARATRAEQLVRLRRQQLQRRAGGRLMRAFVEGIGLVGPGLNGWQAIRATLAGGPYHPAPTSVVASALLPATERRRAGMPVKLALAVGIEAIESAGRDAASLPTVFTSSSGDCDNVHAMCESLATPERQVSPTRFHNSVHNAAAGYWSIATQCRAPSTSLCCHDASFGAGLLDAASQVAIERRAVVLIAYDHPYPAPLGNARPIAASFG